jgi:tetratricopeptide (TPR) repeat protein
MSSTGNSQRQASTLVAVVEESAPPQAAATSLEANQSASGQVTSGQLAATQLALVAPCPADSEAKSISVDAQSLIAQRKLSQALVLLQKQGSERTTPESRLQLTKCLAEQGHFLEALEAATSLQRRRGLEHKPALRIEAGIWKDFISLYIGGNPGSLLKRCRQVLRSVPSERLGTARAVAHDFLARGLVISVHWNLLPRSALIEAAASLEQAEAIFLEKRDLDSALQCLLRRGQTVVMIDASAFETACALFERARSMARAAGLTFREGQACLRLAEAHARRGDRTLPEGTPTSSALYAQAGALFESLGSQIGESEAYLAQAQSIQRYDAFLPESASSANATQCEPKAGEPKAGEPKAGEPKALRDNIDPSLRATIARDLALRAATGYKLAGNLSGQFEALSVVATIALDVSDLAASLEYRFEAMGVANRMGFRVGSASTQLGIADIYLRRGDMQNALLEFRKASSQITVPALQGLGNLSLANAYQLMGLTEQAETTCRAAIEALRGKNNEVLSQAYLVLGNVLSERREFSEALKVLGKGRRFDIKQGYLEASAEKLQLWAQALVLEDKDANKSDTPSPATKERAIRLLQKELARVSALSGSTARQVEAGLWQSLGQIYITCDDVVAALRHLGQARMRYEAAGLLSQRANTDAIIGLAYKLLAQQGNTDVSREAAWHLNQAKQFFKVAGMQEQELRMQALADEDSLLNERQVYEQGTERSIERGTVREQPISYSHGRKKIIH